MPRITTTYPDLTGGVSQQPAATRLPNQCEEQINAVPSMIEGLVKRNPTEHVSRVVEDTEADPLVNLVIKKSWFYETVKRDDTERYTICLTDDPDEPVIVLDAETGVKQAVDFKRADNFSAATDIATYLDTATVTGKKARHQILNVGDVYFLLNKDTVVTDTAVSATAALSSDHLLWVKTAVSNGTYTVTFEDTDGDTREFVATHIYDASSSVNISTSDIVSALIQAASTADGSLPLTVGDIEVDAPDKASDGYTPANAATFTNLGSVLVSNLPITGVSDSGGDELMIAVSDRVEEFSRLPPKAPENHKVLVEGNPESEVDDYWVKYTDGRWVETLGPELNINFTSTTMPVLLVRESDGTFLCGPGSQTITEFNTLGFFWTPRQVGSDLTNPFPSFLDKTISGMSFFKNRLLFLSEDSQILSETGEVFNFFRTTTASLPESDPIDITAGGQAVAKMKVAIPFADRLISFSELQQFSTQGELILTPQTASIVKTTEYEVDVDVAPVIAGSSLFFVFPRGDKAGIKEYFKVNENDVQFNANDVTVQVPYYINGPVRKMAASTHENFLFVSTENDDDLLYGFKWTEGQDSRIQSAWFKFEFDGAVVCHHWFVESKLYLLVLRDGATYLEKMELRDGLTDTGLDFVIHLDRKVLLSGGTYDSATDRTTYTFDQYAPDSVEVVDSTCAVLDIGSTTSTSILMKGNTTGKTLYAGIPYTMSYTVSEPVLKRPSQRGGYELISSGRHQIRYMSVVYDRTGHFKVTVTPENRTAIEYSFPSYTASTIDSKLGSVKLLDGTARFPVFARSREANIVISSDSPAPAKIQSIDFEATYYTKFQRQF